jgi:hypothetical protein
MWSRSRARGMPLNSASESLYGRALISTITTEVIDHLEASSLGKRDGHNA